MLFRSRELFEEWTITRPELVRPEGWLGGDLMNLIVGQGAITTTPIQVANAYKTLLTGYSSSPYFDKNKENIQKVKNYNISDDFIEFLLNDFKFGYKYKWYSLLRI